MDPDDDSRSLHRTCLQLAECDVVEASDGRDALFKALMHPPSLVMTEARLPIFDGLALCEGLRRDVLTRTVPILVVTTVTDPAVVERARAAGADAILVKPSLEAVLEEIRRLLTPSAHLPRAVGVRGTPRTEGSARPPAAPSLVLFCPSCDRRLRYERSHSGGVSNRDPEQWDDYTCPASCGTFQYRQRTRTLRNVS